MVSRSVHLPEKRMLNALYTNEISGGRKRPREWKKHRGRSTETIQSVERR